MIALDAPRAVQTIYWKYWLEKPWHVVNYFIGVLSAWWVAWGMAWLFQSPGTEGVDNFWYYDPHWGILAVVILALSAFQILTSKWIARWKLPSGSVYNKPEVYEITRLYRDLSVGGKQLARPTVDRFYEIYRSGVQTSTTSIAMTKRVRAIERLLEEEKDSKSQTYLDTSDLDALEFVLEAKKSLDDRSPK